MDSYSDPVWRSTFRGHAPTRDLSPSPWARLPDAGVFVSDTRFTVLWDAQEAPSVDGRTAQQETHEVTWLAG